MQIKPIIFISANNCGDVGAKASKLYRRSEYIRVIGTTLPTRLIVDLPTFCNNVRHCGKSNSLCPTEPVSQITPNSTFIENNITQPRTKDFIADRAEEITHLLRKASCALWKFLPCQR